MINAVAIPVRALAWLGRQGTRAIAALVIFGIAVPPLGELLKPYVAEAIFLLLCISFMRVDLAALRDHLRRPGIVLAASAWTMIAVPALIGIFCLAAGIDTSSPDLFLALMLQAVASPMMAAPALAALMGLDSTLALITLVTGTALVPLTAPLFAWMFFGAALTLSPLGLGLKLAVILAGSLGVGIAIRRLFGIAAIRHYREPIDGINILILLVFVSAVMGSVAGSFWADPLQVAGLALLAFAIFFALLGATMLVFRRLGYARAGARIAGVPAQHGPDGGRDRRRAAGPDLAVFRAVAVSDLSIAAAAEADRGEIEGGGSRGNSASHTASSSRKWGPITNGRQDVASCFRKLLQRHQLRFAAGHSGSF